MTWGGLSAGVGGEGGQVCAGRWLLSVFGHALPSAACPAGTVPGVGLWPQELVYPKHGCCSIHMDFSCILHVFSLVTSILASQRQEQAGAVAAVWVCAASHISIPPGGICVFCVCWAHVPSLAATWIWDHGVAASPLLGCCIQIMPFLLAWSSWACRGLQMCVPAINI